MCLYMPFYVPTARCQVATTSYTDKHYTVFCEQSNIKTYHYSGCVEPVQQNLHRNNRMVYFHESRTEFLASCGVWCFGKYQKCLPLKGHVLILGSQKSDLDNCT